MCAQRGEGALRDDRSVVDGVTTVRYVLSTPRVGGHAQKTTTCSVLCVVWPGTHLQYSVQLLWRERALRQERGFGVARRPLAAAAAVASQGEAAVVGVPRRRCWNSTTCTE